MNLLVAPARRIALVALLATIIAIGCKKKSRPVSVDSADPVAPAAVPGLSAPMIDAEGLPTGNDLDSVLVRLNFRYQQNNYFLYQLETENVRLLKNPTFTRGRDVFQTFRGHAGSPAAQPRVGTIPYLAWQRMLVWATKDETPELCQMLRGERIEARQTDLFGKLAEFKDPRCAETVAPFLAVPARRGAAQHLLMELDSTAEKFVLPYLGAGHDKETRVAALQVVAQVGTVESARIVEVMTRDADPRVYHQSNIVFEKLSKRLGTEQDLMAAVRLLKEGIATQNGTAIGNSEKQLEAAYRPDHPQRAEIFKVLIESCKVPDPKGIGKRASFLGALKWSSVEDIGALCELLVSSGGESVVFLKLKDYKDARCGPAVAAFLTVDLKRAEAAEVLKAIGAPAEKAVIPYALRAYPNGAEIPFATRLGAIELLGEVGTKDCVPILRQLAAELNVRDAANKAMAKVASRMK